MKTHHTKISRPKHDGDEEPASKPKMRVNSFDAEMAELARKGAKAEEATAGGTFISTKGNKFSVNGNTIKGDKITAVIVGAAFCNAFYSRPYNQNETTSPDCFAIAEEDAELAPHESCDDPQGEFCAGCPNNRYGTSNTGKGKACKNTRRLALIVEDGEDFTDEGAPFYMLSVAPTSTKAWGSYVQQIFSAKRLPTVGVVTEIEISPVPGKTYSELSFSYVRDLEPEEIAAVLPRRDEAMALCMAPFPKRSEEESPVASRKTGKASTKTASRKFSRK